MELYNVIVLIRFATSETKLVSSVTNFVYKLPHELPKDVRLRFIGNKEILKKSQNSMKILPGAQFLFKKLNFGDSS